MLQFWPICLPAFASCRGVSSGHVGCSDTSVGFDAGPVWGGAGTGWRLPGSVELVHFGGLPGPGMRSGRRMSAASPGSRL